MVSTSVASASSQSKVSRGRFADVWMVLGTMVALSEYEELMGAVELETIPVAYTNAEDMRVGTTLVK